MPHKQTRQLLKPVALKKAMPPSGSFCSFLSKRAVQTRMETDGDGFSRDGLPNGPHFGRCKASNKFNSPCCHTFLICLVLLCVATRSLADELDTLRLKWQEMLTFGTNANKADPNYFAWISLIESNAQSYWSSMNTSPTRTNLWNKYNHLATESSDIAGTYSRLKAMALGYAVQGSVYYGNSSLASNLISGLDWMFTNYYNPNKSQYNNPDNNWFDWEIGTPLSLNDTAVLLYNNLTAIQRSNYMSAIDHFTPTPDTILNGSSPATGANKVWKASILTIRGLVVTNAGKIVVARAALSDVFPYVSSGDGFYTDGSFVFHSNSQDTGGFSYNGGYGAQLLGTLAPLMQLFAGSSWQITDPLQTNLFRWVYDSFQPFIYRGALMQMTDGRYYSRQGDDHIEGHAIIGTILRVAQFAPASDAAAYKSFVKSWLRADSYRDFIQTQPPPVNIWAQAILNDPGTPPTPELVRYSQFPRMDQAVHLRSGWAFALSMSSSRSGNYESIQGENLHGWYTGDGMTYLYNSDLGQYADNFWSTVNPYRMPGTTVDTQPRADSSGEGYLSPNAWVGGASLLDLYGACGMQLKAWNSTLTARKSWFMFDDEVVCLGAGITNTDNRTIETIIENRRLAGYGDNPFLINGIGQPSGVGWSNTLAGVSWAHLAGNTPDGGIGYFFPQSTSIKALREARSGSFYNINSNFGATNLTTRNFLTLWLDHGLNPANSNYAYVLLPNRTPAQVANYAASPDVVILGNSTSAQGVKETTLGITAVNFWSNGSLGGIVVDKRASVIVRNDGSFIDVGLSDPTQTNTGIISLELTNATAGAAISADPGVTVVQTYPTIKLAINVNGAAGQTFHARLFGQTTLIAPVADAYVESGTNSANNFGLVTSLVVKTNGSTTNLTRESFLRFELPPASGVLNATLRLVPSAYATNMLFHGLAPVSDNAWSETGITWNNRPASGPEFARWLVPSTNNPVLVNVTTLAQQAAVADGKLSFRLYTGNPTNTSFSAYASRENSVTTNQPQLILNMGRVPPAILLASPAPDSAYDAPATIILSADVQPGDNPVSKVEFYRGGMKLGQVTGSPYTFSVSNLGPGQYSFNAVVSDTTGLTATSAPVAISVYTPEPSGNGTGLWGEYYTGENLIGLVGQLTRIDPTINFFWDVGSPDGAIASDHYSVRWMGKLQARHAGLHTFSVVADDGARLWLNGRLIIDNWLTNNAVTEATGAVSLLPGQYYDLVLEYFEDTGSALVQLYWREPGGTKQIIPQSQLYPADTGLRGAYYASTNQTKLTFTRIDRAVNFAWTSASNSSPDPTLLPGGFSAQWKGKVRANQAGTYTFYTLSAGGVKLSINNQLLINNWTAHAATENSANISLAAGQLYNLTMDYFGFAGTGTAVLLWTPPGETKQVIPEVNLIPHQYNSPPSLTPLPNLAVVRGNPLTFTALASDPDLPVQSLFFSLDNGAPSGANINPISGAFTWTPSPTQALGDYSITLRATDNGAPNMTDAQTIIVTVTTNNTVAIVTLVSPHSSWRYQDTGVDPGSPWRSKDFDDAAWKSGAAQIGYGTGRESSIASFGPNPNNKYPTTWFRRAFFIPDASLMQNLNARLLRDDGVIVYLNGNEVWRDNLPGGTIGSGTFALSEITGGAETNFLVKSLDPSLLINGTNIIAAEIHQASASGPDIAFDMELTALAIVPAQPAISFAPAGGSPGLAWPFEAGLFQLYAATNLAPPISWFPLTNTPVLSNNQWFLALPPATNRAVFYRLQTK